MGHAEWVEIIIFNHMSNGSITIKGAEATWGHFFKQGNKNREIFAEKVNGTVISKGSAANISSCGRVDSHAGTEGRLDLHNGETKICTIDWNCPWGGKSNDFQISQLNPDYTVNKEGGSNSSGALGTVQVQVMSNT